MLSFEQCKKVLNANNEHYTDEEIKLIMEFIKHWAKINSEMILTNLNTLKK